MFLGRIILAPEDLSHPIPNLCSQGWVLLLWIRLTLFFLIPLESMWSARCSDLLMEEYIGDTEDSNGLQVKVPGDGGRQAKLQEMVSMIRALRAAYLWCEHICKEYQVATLVQY